MFNLTVNLKDTWAKIEKKSGWKENQINNPLQGVTLEMILTRLVEKYGWGELGKRITIQCFINDPSIKSSLKFLRRTPWARKKVEELYLKSIAGDNWLQETSKFYCQSKFPLDNSSPSHVNSERNQISRKERTTDDVTNEKRSHPKLHTFSKCAFRQAQDDAC